MGNYFDVAISGYDVTAPLWLRARYAVDIGAGRFLLQATESAGWLESVLRQCVDSVSVKVISRGEYRTACFASKGYMPWDCPFVL